MSAWSHLPNARHIDWVLKSLKENPELWKAARDADWSAAMSAAMSASMDATSDAAWSVDMSVARYAILALIAYDDCDQFLNMSYEKLQIWAVLSEDPRAVLLLPMIYVKEKLNECMVTSA